jgi:T4-like virus tail tube protein gp19
MAYPETPYFSSKFVVELHSSGASSIKLGAFSELVWHILANFVEVEKIQGTHKVGDVTLKRGIVASSTFWSWIQSARHTGARWDARVIAVEGINNFVLGYRLSGVTPAHFTGPTLGAEGSGELAIEELVLAHEGIQFIPHKH